MSLNFHLLNLEMGCLRHIFMHNIYVGPGSCQGDSGGPLYKKVHDQGKLRLILLGVTSKGHSKIGNCGGIDNPTHYVRVREMLSWIQKYIKKRKLCIIKSKKHKNKVLDLSFIFHLISCRKAGLSTI